MNLVREEMMNGLEALNSALKLKSRTQMHELSMKIINYF